MKKGFLLLNLIIVLVLTNLTLSSCKKKTDPIPDFPQLIGHWSGTTSSDTQIHLMIDNLKGYLYVTQYDLTIYGTSGLEHITGGYTYGVAAVTNKQFRIHLGTGSSGEAYIDGTFDTSSMTLYGTYSVYDPGSSIDLISGTYSASMGTK